MTKIDVEIEDKTGKISFHGKGILLFTHFNLSNGAKLEERIKIRGLLSKHQTFTIEKYQKI